MTEQPEPGQSIAIAAVPDLRDLGGRPTRDGGKVRGGLVYRSTELNKLAGADAAPAQLFKVLSDPQAAAEMLGGGKRSALFAAGYREIVSLPSAGEAYHRLFSDLTEEEHRPASFHCTTGKDRTGWAAASLLMLFGVRDDLVMQEYLLTNVQLPPAEKPLLDHSRALGGDPELLRPVLGVAAEYLEAALDEMRKELGTVEGYFGEALKIDEGAQEALRAAFVESV